MVGRKKEIEVLNGAYDSPESEFVAVYGRRRIGKTYLVRQTFDGRFAFQHTGIARGTTKEQLREFAESLENFGLKECPTPGDWFEAFRLLKKLLSKAPDGKKVVFIDEMPYLDTKASRFVPALEHFWNGWASARTDILLIVCGSATSWVINKVIRNKGGLHNRVTVKIPLKPFTLAECEMYARSRGVLLTRYQLAELYMALGGVPYYWKYVEPDYSVAQNLDSMFFAREDKLEHEYEDLFASLFRQAEPYMRIVEALGRIKAGMTRDRLSKSSGLTACGNFSRHLKELEQCGFIRKYTALGCKNKGSLYQLIDNFTLFYFRIIAANKVNDRHFWSSSQGSGFVNEWRGTAFERLCMLHVDQLKAALGIAGVVCNVYSWQCPKTDDHPGVQIDMLLDRKDGIINLCEMKFSETEYSLDETEAAKLRARRAVFKCETGTRKAIHETMITSFGLKKNAYRHEIQSELTLDDLFAPGA